MSIHSASIKANLSSRVRPGERAKLIERAFVLSDQLETKRNQVSRNSHLTEEGRAAAMARFALEIMPEMNRVNWFLCAEERQAKFNRANLNKIESPDRALPTSLFDESQRQEIRRHLLSMPMAERIQAAFEVAKSPLGADAILSAPIAALHGLPPDVLDQVRAARVQELHGDKLAEQDLADRDNEAVRAAVEFVASEVREASGFSDEVFASAISFETRA